MTIDDPLADDAALVRRAAAGERAAMAPLIARHYPSLLRLCRRLLRDSPEAEDVAQEAALAACLGLDRLREPARFGAWLHAIAANLARLSLRRRRARSLEALGESPGVVRLWSAGLPDPAEVASAREVHDSWLPIIALGPDDAELEARARAAGARSYVAKPASAPALEAALLDAAVAAHQALTK